MRTLLRVYREAFSGLPRDLWILSAAALVNRAGTMVLPFMSLYLTTERGFSVAAAGRLVAVYGVGAVAGAYLGGWLSDHLGAIRAQQTSLVAGGAGFLVLGEIRHPLLLAGALVVVAAIVEAFRPAVMTSFAELSTDALKPKAFAFLRLAVNLGVSIGAALGGVLAVYGYRWLFIGDALTCWLAAVVLVRVSSPPPGASDGMASVHTRRPFRDPPFLFLLLLVLVMASVLFQIFSTLPLYFREHGGLRENAIGLLLALNGLLIVAFEMVLIQLVSRRDRMGLVGVGAFALCLGFALMPHHQGTWYLALTVCVWTFGEMLCLPILNVVVAERAGPGVRGRYMGMFTMAFATAFVVAPVAGTFVYERFGPHALWHGIGALGFMLWLGSLALRPRLMDGARKIGSPTS